MVNEDVTGKINSIESHLEKLLYIQERTTENVDRLSNDIRVLMDRDGDFKVLEAKVGALHKRIDRIDNGYTFIVKTVLTIIFSAVATTVAYVFSHRSM
jgi:hypothetical protein